MEILLKYAPLFGALSAIVAACALWVAAYQLVNAIRWNRVTSAFTYFPNPLTLEALENELDDSIRFWSRKQPLTLEECRLLLFQAELNAEERPAVIRHVRETLASLGREPPSDEKDLLHEMRKTGRKLKAYLNEVERYAAAVNSGVVDELTAYNIYHAKFVGHHDRIGQLVSFVQKTRGAAVYHEFDSMALRWRQPGIIRSVYPARLSDLFRAKNSAPMSSLTGRGRHPS